MKTEEKKAAEMAELEDLEIKMCISGKRTLSLAQEQELINMVLSDPLQDGELMFIMLAFLTGARAKELLRLVWKDIVKIKLPLPISDDLRDLPSSFQTIIHMHLPSRASYAFRFSNSMPDAQKPFRYFPLSDLVYDFLIKRKQHIEKEHGNVDSLPICCKRSDFTTCAELDIVRSLSRKILRKAGIEEDTLHYYDLQLKYCENPCVQLEEFAAIYLFRRTIATYASLFIDQSVACELLDIPLY